MITANGFGSSGQVVETLPPGFSYVSSSLSDGAVTVEDRELSFILFEQTAFTYTVDASSTEGTYSFSGVLTNFTREEFPVAGALTITVGALPAVSVSRAAGGGGHQSKARLTGLSDGHIQQAGLWICCRRY